MTNLKELKEVNLRSSIFLNFIFSCSGVACMGLHRLISSSLGTVPLMLELLEVTPFEVFVSSVFVILHHQVQCTCEQGSSKCGVGTHCYLLHRASRWNGHSSRNTR